MLARSLLLAALLVVAPTALAATTMVPVYERTFPAGELTRFDLPLSNAFPKYAFIVECNGDAGFVSATSVTPRFGRVCLPYAGAIVGGEVPPGTYNVTAAMARDHVARLVVHGVVPS